MTDLYRHVRDTLNHRAHRRLPSSWAAAEPDLAGYATIADLIPVVRDLRDHQRSDRVVRALANLAARDTHASLVLLEALAREAVTRPGPYAGFDFVDEVLTELALVIQECGDLSGLDHLVKRLTRRAYRRARRRAEEEDKRGGRQYAISDHHEPVDPRPPVANAAIARLQVDQVCRLVGDALATGRLSAGAWTLYRDGRLAPLFGGDPIDERRERIYRAGKVVRRHVSHAA